MQRFSIQGSTWRLIWSPSSMCTPALAGCFSSFGRCLKCTGGWACCMVPIRRSDCPVAAVGYLHEPAEGAIPHAQDAAWGEEILKGTEDIGAHGIDQPVEGHTREHMRLHVVQCKVQTDSFLAFPSDMSGESDCSMVFWPEDRVSALILEKQALTVSLTVAHLSTAAFGHATAHPWA